MWIYLLCMLAGIGLFLGIPHAIRATGIKRFYLGIGAEFHQPDDESQKKLDEDDEPAKKLKE